MPARPEPAAERRRILRERARALARPLDEAAPRAMLDVLEFRLGEERYAFEAGRVHDVQPLLELTPLPGTPEFIAGIVNVHGRLVAVIDLKRFFDLPQPGITDLHSIILLRSDGREIGLLADTVAGVYGLAADDIQTALHGLSGIHTEYLRGVTAERLAVLDAEAILADPRLVINEDVEL